MSTVSVINVKHPSSASNNLVLDNAGNAAFANNVTVAGNMTSTGMVVPSSSFLRNKIINGAMEIDQRNAGASATFPTDGYVIDRWYCAEQTDGVMSIQQVVDAPAGFVNSARVTTTTADASLSAAQYVIMTQAIEGFNTIDLAWGTASARPVTLSFWVKSSLTGTFGGAIVNSNVTRSYPFTYAISSANTWEYKTVTVPGDTTGTWLTNNGKGVDVRFGLGVGANNSGPAGSWSSSAFFSATGAVSVIGTLNATWNITGVQLEVGTVATPFERRQFGQELLLCQRYFQRFFFQLTTYAAQYASAGGAGGFWGFPCPYIVTMRTQPTATFIATPSTNNYWTIVATTSVSANSTANIFVDVGAETWRFRQQPRVAGGSSPTDGAVYVWENSFTVTFSAEL